MKSPRILIAAFVFFAISSAGAQAPPAQEQPSPPQSQPSQPTPSDPGQSQAPNQPTIKVTTGSGRKLYNHVTTSVGFMSSSDRRVHFGLGPETKIDHVEIRWPSGIVQRLEPTAVDRIVKVEEPKEMPPSS